MIVIWIFLLPRITTQQIACFKMTALGIMSNKFPMRPMDGGTTLLGAIMIMMAIWMYFTRDFWSGPISFMKTMVPEFLRELLEIEGIPNYQEIVKRQFAAYIESQLFNATQISFLRAVQSVFLQKRHLGRADLYDPPLNVFGTEAVERLFTPTDIDALLQFTRSIAI